VNPKDELEKHCLGVEDIPTYIVLHNIILKPQKGTKNTIKIKEVHKITWYM
jgi:hypothetical protein